MITMAIGLGAGVFYWLGIYKPAFWILIYAIVYGGLSVLRGHGHIQPIYRRDSGLHRGPHSGRLAYGRACRLSVARGERSETRGLH